MNTSVLHMKRILAFEESRPRGIKPMLVVDLSLFTSLLVSFLTDLVVLVNDSLDLLLGHDSFTDQFVAVDVKNIGMLLDDRVHDRLGEHWLIDLIVSKFSVSNKVNDNIPAIICIRIKAAVPRKKKFTYAKLLSIQQQC